MHARLVSGRAQILTRRGNNWTDKYPAIVKFIAGLPAHNAYLDGELCGVLPDGRTAFNLIQNATDTGEGSLVFFLFDLLHLDGANMTALPLVDQNMLLAASSESRRGRALVLYLQFEKAAEVALGLPPGVHSYALLPIGYPMGRFGPVRRVALADIVYKDRWGQAYRDL